MTEIDRTLHDWPYEDPEHVDLVVGPGRTSDNAQFGELLANLREHTGMSRADAAAALGVSPEYLRLIERGKRTPALGQMRSLLDAYRADGEVGSLQPNGDMHDLIFFHPRSDEPVSVQFTSRIREARSSAASYPRGGSSRRAPILRPIEDQCLSSEHAADLGFVVSLLARADHGTICAVRDWLQSEVVNGAATDG